MTAKATSKTNKHFTEFNSTADKEFFNIMRESNYKTKKIHEQENIEDIKADNDDYYTEDEIIDIAVQAAKTLAYEYEGNIPEDPDKVYRNKDGYTIEFGKVEPTKLYKNDVEPVNITVFINTKDLKSNGTRSFVMCGDLNLNFSYNEKDGIVEEDYSLWSSNTKYPDYSAKTENDIIFAAKRIIDANLYTNTINTDSISVCEPYGADSLNDEDMKYLQKVYNALYKKDIDDVIIKDKYHSEIKLSFCTIKVNLGGRKQEYMWIIPNNSNNSYFEISASHWLLGYQSGKHVSKISKSEVKEQKVNKTWR